MAHQARRLSPRARAWALALAMAALTALASRPPRTVVLDVGGPVGALLGEGWSESRRTDLEPEIGALAGPDAGGRFRFRAAAPNARVALPVAARAGDLRLALRAMARVRTAAAVHVGGRPAAEVVVPRGLWRRHEAVLPGTAGEPFEASLALRPLPLVRVPDEYMDEPRLWIASLEVSSESGLGFTPRARALLGAVPLAVFLFFLAAGLGTAGALGAALLAAAAVVTLAALAPAPLFAALPRLGPAALLAAALSRLALSRAREVPVPTRAALSALVLAGTLAHGALPFVPGFDPYDVEVHVRRAQDLGRVPLEYGAWIRYGSHLPTETQTFGTATAALGERTLIPYSPLPYVFFYALHALGIDLQWGMIALDAALAMALVPWLWMVAAAAWSPGAAWLAAVLYTLDLPVWHHLGRAHVPASFGAALGTAALLFLAREAARLEAPRRVALAAALLAVAMLGYSSLVVFFALFGAVLLVLFALDARALSAAARRGVIVALVGGGLVAGALFYFHYLPGLVGGIGALQQEPDLFQPRTYFLFHNESRQAMRVWQAGFALPLLAGYLAAPVALRAAAATARPVLAAWLLTWPLVMLAKEPFLFPRPLRWAKEDQFISPLLALMIGAGIWSLPRPWMRWSAAVVALAVAAWLQAGDFRVHASGILQ